MTVFTGTRTLSVALAVLGIAAMVEFAPAAAAAPVAANDLLLCVSDTDFGCFGSSAGNSVSLFWNGTTLNTGKNGDGTITSDSLTSGDNGLSVDASLGDFSVNIATGLFNPSPGTAMDLNSLDISTTGPATLYLVFGADNYEGTGPYNELGSVTLNSGVTSATDTACYEPGSGGFYICGGSSSPDIGSATATSTGALDFNSSTLSPSSTFGLEEDVKVTFSGSGTFSGDLSMTSTPEPATMMLVGAGLLAVGLLRRKSGKRSR